MALSAKAAKELIEELLLLRDEDDRSLALLHDYARGHQPHPVTLDGVPPEVQRFVDMSRVNIIDLVVEVLGQSLYVDGYRPNLRSVDARQESPGWEVWQANRMDSRQTGVHRAGFIYGVAYVMVLPGDPVPVIRGYSPRSLTVAYGEDPDWPVAALHTEPNGQYQTLTLYDAEARYRFTTEGGLVHVTTDEYDYGTGVEPGVCPVIRFLNVQDLDEDLISEVERLIPIQDQIDVTTFGLIVAQHYQAFLQRYIVGWEAKTEAQRMRASASRLWTFEDPEVKVGQFTQAQMEPYLKSREDSVQLGAVISQTPPHHLLGELINLSAEALAAAEAGHRRKIAQRETNYGESWEQTLQLVGLVMGQPVDASSQVRWRDTEARSLAQTVDALGKMAQMLNIPPEALWERIPGATQQDIALWRQLADQADSLGQLTSILEAQGLGPRPVAAAPVAEAGA